MLQRPWLGAAATGLVLASAAAATAQIGTSLNRVGSGARAAGMGDAFIAVSDDGTAASWNPAGLAQLRQPEFSLVYVVSNRGFDLTGLRSPDDRFAYSNERFRYTNSSVDFASAALPLSVARKPVTVQFGWQRLYQLGTRLEANVERQDRTGTLAPAAISRSDELTGNIDVLSISASARLTSRLAVGASFNLWRGRWDERVAVVEDPGAPAASAFFMADSHVRLRGHNLAAGVLLTYPAWNVGLVYHEPFWTSYHLSGQSRSTVAEPQAVDTPAARFRLPRSIGAGVARRLGPRWTAAMALTHDQWTDALVDRLPGQDGPRNFFDQAPPEFSTTRDTLSFNAGVEHLVVREGSVVPLRMGFGLEPQGAMDPSTRDPVTYRLLSAGAGYNTNRFKLDAAVQYRWESFRSSDFFSVNRLVQGGGSTPEATGRAAAREWRLKVSVIYRVADTDKLKGVLRRIFG
jgi:hypothetical protein